MLLPLIQVQSPEGMFVTVTVAEPDFVESVAEVALTVAVPVDAGVKTPETLTAPMPVGLTDQVTDVL